MEHYLCPGLCSGYRYIVIDERVWSGAHSLVLRSELMSTFTVLCEAAVLDCGFRFTATSLGFRREPGTQEVFRKYWLSEQINLAPFAAGQLVVTFP